MAEQRETGTGINAVPGAAGAAGGRIVVGVDGSPSSARALHWALHQARLTGASLDATASWEYPPSWGWSVPVADVDLSEGMHTALADTVEQVLAAEPPGQAPVEVRRHVVHGNAAQALLDTARGADLLVLGNRGHGGFTGALLGSVGQHCVQHASCPVVIVRYDETAEDATDE